jgi:hypothetical protein
VENEIAEGFDGTFAYLKIIKYANKYKMRSGNSGMRSRQPRVNVAGASVRGRRKRDNGEAASC